MQIELIPLLTIQQELYQQPSGFERFRWYLQTLLKDDKSDVDLFPMVVTNPMGKPHVANYVDALIALEAEAIAKEQIDAATSRLAKVSDPFKLGLTVADDRMGGWTNRFSTDFAHRFSCQAQLKRHWISATFWTSESPTASLIRETVFIAIYRTNYILQHGFPRTLADMMAQEGDAMRQAGCTQPSLPPEDMDYTESVIRPYLAATDTPTQMVCLFGDVAAESLGYKPQGLSPNAGLALALHQASTNHMTVA
ncbi:MAG: hypothetical protein AAFY78_23095 [Cyanobacteria bacterium J06648_16]